MKKLFSVLLLFVSTISVADEPAGITAEEEYYDYEMAYGITIYGEFPSDSVEAVVLNKLNGPSKDREQFIKEDLLRNAGFMRNANARFRKTTGEEKALSVWHRVTHELFKLIILIPIKPFSEVEYARLPKSKFYSFDSIIDTSPFKNLNTEVQLVIGLEYMLQIEFCNGILIRDWNQKYYTDENIAVFEKLTKSLPDSPPSIGRIKDRYLNEELPKIKAALERFENPGEDFLRAMQNLDSLSLHSKLFFNIPLFYFT